jgi:hypothetical protein
MVNTNQITRSMLASSAIGSPGERLRRIRSTPSPPHLFQPIALGYGSHFGLGLWAPVN